MTGAFHASTGWRAARAAASEERFRRREGRVELRGIEAVEREAGTQQRLHAVAGGEICDGARLAGEQSGGIADVEPLGKEAGGGDAAHGFVEERELRLRDLAVGLVGGEQMRHDALKPERRTGAKVREDCGEAHSGRRPGGSCRCRFRDGWAMSPAALPRRARRLRARRVAGLPRDGRQLELNCGCGLAGKDAGNDEHASLRAKRARGNALFHAGDAEPLRSRAHGGRSAESQRVAVGVGLDDGEQLGMGSGEARKKTVVLFESAGANLNPAGAHWHGGFQGSVYRGWCGGSLWQQRKGDDGFVLRSDLVEQLCFEMRAGRAFRRRRPGLELRR